MDEKATNSLVSLAKSLANRKGRPEGLAESIVRKSESFTAVEAKDQAIIEILASDQTDLLRQMDSRPLNRNGAIVTLNTKSIVEHALPMTWVDRFLDALSDPTIASIFLSLGALGVAYEFASPGVGMGGIVGIICILLGLMALSALPLHLGGLLLILAGLISIGLEVKLQTHGLLGVGGAIGVLLGALVLVDPSGYFGATQSLRVFLFLPFIALITLAFLSFAALGAKALRKPTITGIESMKGKVGVAKCQFAPINTSFEGMVFVDGARWQAKSNEPIEQDAPIVVLQVTTKPTRLLVKNADKGAS
jgi:membrane-bound serine protease (ClpP class)